MSKGSKPTDTEARTQRQKEADAKAALPKKPQIRKWRILLITAGLMLLAGISTVFGMMMAVASELPKLEDRQQYKISKPSIMYDDTGKVITRLRNNQNRILVTSNQISPTMKQAVISIEDRRFYEHGGVDARGIARAIAADAMGGGAKQGASTITQQFVKNALAAQSQRTVMQKLREAALAYHLEHKWTKDKILTEYLNAIYYGNGAYGIESAAETYFGKAHPECAPHCAEKLLPWEAAMLAGVIASPSAYDPVVYPARATDRRNQVLTNMFNQGYITQQLLDQGKLEAVPTEDEITRPKENSVAPYFSTYVRQQLVDRYGAGTAFGGGLKVHTTLDLEMQAAAKNAVQTMLPYGGPSAALVAIDNKTGQIRALYGGDDANYNANPFNLATQGQRQPGSSFKPFTLITALKRGYGLGSVWKSAKIGGAGTGTLIKNYGDSYAGAISMLGATTTSDNTAYVRIGLAQKVGVNRVARQAKSMGISTQISRNTAMILGGLSEGVTPLEMAYAYTSIANLGRKPVGTLAPDDNSPVAIDKVIQDGKLFRKQRDHTKYDRVFSQKVGSDAQEAMRSVVTSGTGKKADPGFWVAGKTGTTENYGDAWFVGFSQDISVAIWVGYPDKTVPMLDQFGGEPVAGGTFPALIFQNFIIQAQQIFADRKAGKKGSTEGTSGLVGPPDLSPYEGDSSGGTTDKGNGGGAKQKDTTTTPKQNNTPQQPATQPQQPATEPQQPQGGGGNGDAGGAAPGT
jgi:penicillin-binding protein 1A